jgi:hypothetical protein
LLVIVAHSISYLLCPRVNGASWLPSLIVLNYEHEGVGGGG